MNTLMLVLATICTPTHKYKNRFICTWYQISKNAQKESMNEMK